MAISKIVLNGITQMDLTEDTVTQAEHIMAPYTGHLASGLRVTGTGTGGSSTISGLAGKNIIFLGDSIGAGTNNDNHSFVDIIDEKNICASVIKECHASATIGGYEAWSDGHGYDCIAMIQAQSTNIANADIIFIEYGGNDSYSLEQELITLGTINDTSSTTSICGYAKRAIENIRTINPTIEIVWLLPYIDDYDFGSIASYVNRDYRIAVTKAIIMICSSLDVAYFGLYSHLNPAKNGAHLVNDSASHPSEAGHALIADNIIWGYPYKSDPYRPLRIITLNSDGTYDGVFASLKLLAEQRIDIQVRYNGMIFYLNKFDATSIVFSAITISETTETEYVFVITASSTAMYSTTRSLTAVPWSSTPTPSVNYETIYENDSVLVEPQDGGVGFTYVTSLADIAIPEGSTWRVTVDGVPAVETATYISRLDRIGIIHGESGHETVFYQTNDAWIFYYADRNSGTVSIKIERAVTEN